MKTNYVNIYIYDRAGNQTSFMSSTAGVWPVLSAKFSLHKNGGCGAFEMVCNRETVPGTIASNYLIEFWADAVESSGLARYYRGVITTVPGSGTTAREVRYAGLGLWLQAEKQTVIKDFEGADIDDIVEDILDDIDNDSDISTSTTEISVASPHTLGDFEPEYMSAAKAIELLAGVQQDIQYGIDQDGKLYFKDIITTDQKSFWVGKHVESFEPESLSDDIINRVYLQSKEIVGGGSLTLARSDTTSITNNGLRDKVVRVPHLATWADVWSYGEHILDTNDIKTVASTKLTGFSDFIFPRGNARITTTDGTEYSLPIDSVTYTLDGTRGLVGEMGIGDEPVPDWGTEVMKLLRELATNRSNAISLTKIEHTRGEEWARAAGIDAKVNGNLNTFFDTFQDINAIDQAESLSIAHDKKREFIGPVPGGDATTIISNVIPTGEEIDDVRVHLDQDWAGRVDFKFKPEDKSDFFVEDGGTWGINGDEGMMQQSAAGGRNRLEYTSALVLPLGYKVNAAFYYQTSNQTGQSGIATNINPAAKTDSHFLITIANEAANTVARLYSYTGGTPTLRDSGNLIKDQNYLLEIEQNNTVIGCAISNIGGSASSDLLTYNHGGTAVASRYVAIQGLYQGAAKDYYVDYFEIPSETTPPPYVGKIEIYVSRDNGTTWTSITNTAATTNKNLDISGQPSGTQLRLKAVCDHPCRLYGWGISFSN